MYYTAEQISQILNGTIEGNSEVKVNRPSKIEEGGKGSITFLANPKYEDYIYTTDASIVLVGNEIKLKEKVKPTLIRVDNVYESLGILLEQISQSERVPNGVSENSIIDNSAQLDSDVRVGDFSIIGENSSIEGGTVIHDQVYIGPNVKIGKNCLFYPGVRILRNTEIGDNCIFHSNAVIGSDGFGFSKSDDGTYTKIPQVGKVVIKNDVEVGAHVTIDRATMGETTIEKGVKLDNLIQIAHNVRIGSNTAIAAQTGIAGSSKIGKNNVIGGQVGIAGHLNMPDNIYIQAQSGINSDKYKDGDKLFGSPALNYNSYLKSYSVFKELPKLRKEIEELKTIIDKLK